VIEEKTDKDYISLIERYVKEGNTEKVKDVIVDLFEVGKTKEQREMGPEYYLPLERYVEEGDVRGVKEIAISSFRLGMLMSNEGSLSREKLSGRIHRFNEVKDVLLERGKLRKKGTNQIRGVRIWIKR